MQLIESSLVLAIISFAAECSSLKADILFIFDASSSVGITNFNKEKDFVKALINSFPIGPKAVQVGRLTFSTTDSYFYLISHTTKSTLLKAISDSPYTTGNTHTEKALHDARTIIFTPPHGDRPDAPNIVVLLTDGYSNDRVNTQKEAALLHKAGVRVITVGIGHYNLTELGHIASSPNDTFVVVNFSQLGQQFVGLILQSVCRGMSFNADYISLWLLFYFK